MAALSCICGVCSALRLWNSRAASADEICGRLLPAGGKLGLRLSTGLPASFAIPLWTVSIEEQFYLAWPLAVRRASVRMMAAIAVGLLVLANAWRVWLAISAAPVDAMEYNTFTRLDPIALGILIALFGHKLPRSFARHRSAACSAAGSCHMDRHLRIDALPATPPLFSTWRLALGHPLTAIASAAVLLSVMGSQHALLRNRTLLYLGKISYGLYVLHEFAHYCAAV